MLIHVVRVRRAGAWNRERSFIVIGRHRFIIRQPSPATPSRRITPGHMYATPRLHAYFLNRLLVTTHAIFITSQRHHPPPRCRHPAYFSHHTPTRPLPRPADTPASLRHYHTVIRICCYDANAGITTALRQPLACHTAEMPLAEAAFSIKIRVNSHVAAFLPYSRVVRRPLPPTRHTPRASPPTSSVTQIHSIVSSAVVFSSDGCQPR